MTFGRWVLVLVLLAGTVAVAAEVDPSAPQLGERARLILDRAPVDSTTVPRGVGIVLRETADPTVYEIVVARVGEALVVLPATGDTLRWSVSPRLAQATPDSLRPIDRIGAIQPTYWPHLIAALALLMAVLWWLRRWRRRRPPPMAFEPPAEPPHEVALRRLKELRRSGWISGGRLDEVYVEASHALRGYVSGRYRVPALDWTTSETVQRLAGAGHDVETVRAVDPLLRAADAVKFAAHRPSEHQTETWLDEAETWIRTTSVPVVYSTPEAVAAARKLHSEGGA